MLKVKYLYTQERTVYIEDENDMGETPESILGKDVEVTNLLAQVLYKEVDNEVEYGCEQHLTVIESERIYDKK